MRCAWGELHDLYKRTVQQDEVSTMSNADPGGVEYDHEDQERVRTATGDEVWVRGLLVSEEVWDEMMIQIDYRDMPERGVSFSDVVEGHVVGMFIDETFRSSGYRVASKEVEEDSYRDRTILTLDPCHGGASTLRVSDDGPIEYEDGTTVSVAGSVFVVPDVEIKASLPEEVV